VVVGALDLDLAENADDGARPASRASGEAAAGAGPVGLAPVAVVGVERPLERPRGEPEHPLAQPGLGRLEVARIGRRPTDQRGDLGFERLPEFVAEPPLSAVSCAASVESSASAHRSATSQSLSRDMRKPCPASIWVRTRAASAGLR
jgi:hypothetical protein